MAGVPPELARSYDRLHRLGVQLAMPAEGMLLGQVMVQTLRFDPLEPVVIHPLQRFEVLPGEKIRVIGSSPLAHLGPVSFATVQQPEHFPQLLELAWREHVRQTKAAIIRARQLARDTQFFLDPWRIEGSVEYNGERVRLLFSSKGDRACVCGINGRPVVEAPRLPRVILPVEPADDFLETDRKWRVAIEQARACLGKSPQEVEDEGQLSLDIASRDLETSYLEEPEGLVPIIQGRPPAGPGSGPAPVRSPDPAVARRPSPSLSPRPSAAPGRGPGVVAASNPRPATRPSARPLTAVPTATPLRLETSVSLDLTSDDLPT